MRIPVPLKVFLIIQLIHIIEDAKMIFAHRMALLLLIGYLLYDTILFIIKNLSEENLKKLKVNLKNLGHNIAGVWAVEEYIMFPLFILDTINWVSYILPFGSGIRCTPYYKSSGLGIVPTEYNGIGFKHVKNAPQLDFIVDRLEHDISIDLYYKDKVYFYFDDLAVREIKNESDARYFRKLIFENKEFASVHWSENNIFTFIMAFLLSSLRENGLSFTSTLSALSSISVLESVTYSYPGDFSEEDANNFISSTFSLFINPKFYSNMIAILFRFVTKIILFIEDILIMISDAFRIIDTIMEMTTQTLEEVSQTLANAVIPGSAANIGGPVVGASLLTV